MMWDVCVRFKGRSEKFEVDATTYYDAKIEGAKMFLERHPFDRGHDDSRRHYSIPVRPYYLVSMTYVTAKNKRDRRTK